MFSVLTSLTITEDVWSLKFLLFWPQIQTFVQFANVQVCYGLSFLMFWHKNFKAPDCNDTGDSQYVQDPSCVQLNWSPWTLTNTTCPCSSLLCQQPCPFQLCECVCVCVCLSMCVTVQPTGSVLTEGLPWRRITVAPQCISTWTDTCTVRDTEHLGTCTDHNSSYASFSCLLLKIWWSVKIYKYSCTTTRRACKDRQTITVKGLKWWRVLSSWRL